MAQFRISPGITIREVDQSQYAATQTGTANAGAIVGYAEKGPLGVPTLITSQQDFVDQFGKTLADVPYLAQAAYKYFDEGQSLYVVRAGDDRDPEAYPNAAQYATKTIRINPEETTATAGQQEFSATSGLIAGTYTPSATYTFNVVADYKAFQSTKSVEPWTIKMAETYNGNASPIPSETYTDVVLKLGFTTLTDNTFVTNLKFDEDTATAEYSGTGTRTGVARGDTLTTTLYLYRSNDTYQDDATNYFTLNGTYGAAVMGTVNLFSGFDFGNDAKDFSITLGETPYSITLDSACTDADDVVDLLNAKFLSAAINDKVVAFQITPTLTSSYVGLKHIGTGLEEGFSLTQGTSDDACVTIGWAPTSYSDTDGMVGRYDAQKEGVAYSGDIVVTKGTVVTGALSFQDTIPISVNAPENGTWELATIASDIQSALNNAYASYNYPKSRALCAVNVTTSRIRVTAGSVATSAYDSIVRLTAGVGNDLISLLGGTEAYVDGDPTESVGESKIVLSAKEKGSYGNDLILRVEVQTVRTGSSTITYNNVYVLLDGNEVSVYPKISWTAASASNYILTKMADDGYLTITAEDEDGNTTLVALPAGDYTLGDGDLPNGVTAQQAEISDFTVGTNGWVETSGVITSMSADFVNALDTLSNPEEYEFILVAAPGDASSTVQNAVQDLCNSRRDCFGIVDAAEFGLGLGIKAKTREITEVNDACSTLTSSYVGAFWPWVQDYDSDNAQYIWLPPSIYAMKAMVYTDNVYDPWYAPAGLKRGTVSASDLEYSPNSTDRDILYGDTAIVNPIVKFVNEGINIWGQKTAQRTLSATDRINVRRLLIHAEKLIAKMARGFLFEPNDSSNWAAFARQANAILEPIRQRRGLSQFVVVCDETTNTSDLIDQNIMSGKIYLQPTKTIEFISVDFTVSASGELTVTEA